MPISTPLERETWTREQYQREMGRLVRETEKLEAKAAECMEHYKQLARETVKFTVDDLPLLKGAA